MKKILITGSSNGLGKYLSEKFSSQGHLVYGVSRSDSKINNDFYKHFIADISKIEDLENIYDYLDEIDILINNASIFSCKNFSDETLTSISNMIDVNIKGTIFCTHIFLKKLQKNSRIIFINSVSGLEYLEKQSLYSASKFAINSFSHIIARELHEKHIKITNIFPGAINTNMQKLFYEENNLNYDKVCRDSMLQCNDIYEIINFILNCNNNIELRDIKVFSENNTLNHW